jgi:hypothetical protein
MTQLCQEHRVHAVPAVITSAARDLGRFRRFAALALLATRVDAQKLYITNQVGASITVVDQAKLAIDTTIDLKKLGFSANAKPHHTVVEPDGSFWYATLIGDGKVLKFDRANKLVGQVSMETPGLLALDPKHDSLFVGRSMTAVNPPKSLGVIKRSAFELVDEQEIQIPRPHALVVTRDGKWVHAASLGENRIASLETRPVASHCRPSRRQLPLDGAVHDQSRRKHTRRRRRSFELGDDVQPRRTTAARAVFGSRRRRKAWDPVFSPDGKRAYFTLFADSGVAELDLSGAKPRVTRTLRGGMSQPYDMIMRADGKYLFVVNQNLAPVKPGASAHDNMPGMGAPDARRGRRLYVGHRRRDRQSVENTHARRRSHWDGRGRSTMNTRRRASVLVAGAVLALATAAAHRAPRAWSFAERVAGIPVLDSAGNAIAIPFLGGFDVPRRSSSTSPATASPICSCRSGREKLIFFERVGDHWSGAPIVFRISTSASGFVRRHRQRRQARAVLRAADGLHPRLEKTTDEVRRARRHGPRRRWACARRRSSEYSQCGGHRLQRAPRSVHRARAGRRRPL